MKGMELSKMFYESSVKPLLMHKLPKLTGLITAGLVGEGSECFGFDDELSHDHDWGATVCLWLDQKDYNDYGKELSSVLAKLPDTFLGYPVKWVKGRNGVLETQSFFQKYIHKETNLSTVGEWLYVPESFLATASNGQIFEDNNGTFRSIWENLRQGYPEDIRLKKIAYHCTQIGQSGQYNYPRIILRSDMVAAQLAITTFMEEVMAVVYLLNKKYPPFYKWMFRGLQDLEILGTEISSHLNRLLNSQCKQKEIEEICELLICEFHNQGISKEQDFYMGTQAENIHSHISLEALRNTDPWAA